MLTPDDLRMAADCCELQRRPRLATLLRAEALHLEQEAEERRRPFNLTAEEEEALIKVMKEKGTASAVLQLREKTNRSLRACLDLMRSLREADRERISDGGVR